MPALRRGVESQPRGGGGTPAAAFALTARPGAPWPLALKRGQAKSQGAKSGADPNWTAQLSCLPVIIADECEEKKGEGYGRRLRSTRPEGQLAPNAQHGIY